jgi:maltose alpha-D-glucosyltransferase/alpha-amylase
LTERRQFAGVPRICGSLEYARQGEEYMTLGTLQELINHEGNGWDHASDELARYYERAAARLSETGSIDPEHHTLAELLQSEPPAALVETLGLPLRESATLGKRTAEMHMALAAGVDDPAFAPEPLTTADWSAWSKAAINLASKALAALERHVHTLPTADLDHAYWLLAQRSHLTRKLGEMCCLDLQLVKIRCHGDFHLGHVLWSENNFVIIGFAGDPAKSLEERRAKHCSMRDVATMLRSLHYAAYAGLFNFTRSQPDDFNRLEPWAKAWQRWITASFLKQYRTRAEGATFLPAIPADFAALLEFFILGRALRELLHELNDRPEWVRFPLRDIVYSIMPQAQTARREPALMF